ncbi:glycosyl hydrolase family 18 protein [Fimbriimonas ginsengisoli]|uniref:Spore peptidoglycan hydrolase n=1 Tax=Fimbriimonas ginsengisoli Gsoil 348 TaxID=661478 RepID=A0A068NR15_FIMGI|nr:glycosyl hydrolase family 18 protein [Fimbriimonas ginsengisoli]AIE85881.1 spore peptidoglycan hydrolase [Fimbriimonas ginsengisoli Gsoil 348]
MVAPLIALALAMTPTPHLKVSGWLVFFDNGESLATFEKHADQLDTVGVEWTGCDPAGHSIRRDRPTAAEKKKVLRIARKHGVKVLGIAANAANGDFTPAGVEKALASEKAMRRHASELTKIAIEDGLDGIDLDYESLRAVDRAPFTRFVAILSKSLHARKLTLAIALHPKMSEPGNWDGSQAQDFAALGRLCDIVRVMTYDEHWLTSDAGPVASPAWVEQVMRFASSVIPASKLDMGIPAYGYDWVGKQATSFTWADLGRLSLAHGRPTRDPASQELTLRYDNHTAFFADGPAQRSKLQLAKKLRLHGVAMWRLGSEDPSVWTEFRKGK